MSHHRPTADECPRGIDAGAYALGALQEDETRFYAEHLRECALCRREVEALRLVVGTLPLAAPQTAPPAALKRRIMSVVDAEAELLHAAGPNAERRPAAPSRRRRWLPVSLGGLRPAFVGALACSVLALGVIAGLALDGGGQPETRTLAAWAEGRATAKLELSGESASLQLSDMPSPPAGQVYQVWLERAGGRLEPTHTLFGVRSDGRANVAIDASVKGVERILVTAEPRGGSLAPSSKPVITATPA